MRRPATIALVATAAAVSLGATTAAPTNGLPAYTDGFRTWAKINRKVVTGGSAAHAGVKNVYRSKARAGKVFPNGTVIVKTIAPAGSTGPPAQVAVMRKVNGRWRWVEYAWSADRYSVLAQGATCTSCHMQAKANDWVFTRP